MQAKKKKKTRRCTKLGLIFQSFGALLFFAKQKNRSAVQKVLEKDEGVQRRKKRSSLKRSFPPPLRKFRTEPGSIGEQRNFPDMTQMAVLIPFRQLPAG